MTWHLSKDFFTIRISSTRYLPYLESLAIPNLETLEIMRSDVSVPIFECIVKYRTAGVGLVALNHSEHLNFSNNMSLLTRSSGQKPVTPKLLNSFFFHHIRLWKCIPPGTNALSISSLERPSLIDLSNYLKGDFYSSFY